MPVMFGKSLASRKGDSCVESLCLAMRSGPRPLTNAAPRTYRTWCGSASIQMPRHENTISTRWIASPDYEAAHKRLVPLMRKLERATYEISASNGR